MAFSYDLTTAVGKIRLETGDKTFEAGILPEGANFSDEELQLFFDEEGSHYLAVARTFDATAAAWGPYPSFVKLGPESQSLPAAEFYAKKAHEARTKNRRPKSIPLTKADYGLEVT